MLATIATSLGVVGPREARMRQGWLRSFFALRSRSSIDHQAFYRRQSMGRLAGEHRGVFGSKND